MIHHVIKALLLLVYVYIYYMYTSIFVYEKYVLSIKGILKCHYVIYVRPV